MSRGSIREGKTKKIWRHPATTADVLVESKDDVTAGDGARREQFEGKGACSTRMPYGASNCSQRTASRTTSSLGWAIEHSVPASST